MDATTPQAAVIDLGEAGWAPPETGERRARRPRSSPYRLAGTALAVAAVLSIGGAASGPGALTPTRIPTALGESVETQGEYLFVMRPHRNQAAPAGRTVTAYRLPDGERLWRLRFEDSVGTEYLGAYPVGDAVLIGRYGTNGDLTAVDGRTGERRWRRPGRFMGVVAGPGGAGPGNAAAGAGGELVLVGSAPGILPADAPEPEPETVTAVDLRTGATAWSHRPPVDALVLGWYERDAPATSVVIGLPSGRIEVRDSATAEVISTVDARPPVETLAPGESAPWLLTTDGLALVMNPDATLSAFALPGLERRWTIPWEGGQLGWYGPPSCGGLICLQLAEDRVHAIDPATGQLRWAAPWSLLSEVRSVLLGGAEHEYAGQQRISLLDPATGQATADLGVWEVAGPVGAGLALVRYNASTRVARFGLLEPGAADVRLAGAARGIVGDCFAGRAAMVCRALDASVAVYRLR